MKIKAGNWPFTTLVPLPVSVGSLKVNCTPSASTDVRPSVQYHDTGPLVSDSNLYCSFASKQTGLLDKTKKSHNKYRSRPFLI